MSGVVNKSLQEENYIPPTYRGPNQAEERGGVLVVQIVTSCHMTSVAVAED